MHTYWLYQARIPMLIFVQDMKEMAKRKRKIKCFIVFKFSYLKANVDKLIRENLLLKKRAKAHM